MWCAQDFLTISTTEWEVTQKHLTGSTPVVFFLSLPYSLGEVAGNCPQMSLFFIIIKMHFLCSRICSWSPPVAQKVVEGMQDAVLTE